MKPALSSEYLTGIAFFLTSILVQSFGDLIVLRHSSDGFSATRELTCISEDDDSALVWNYNYQTGGITNDEKIADYFQPKKSGPKNNTECAIWNSTECVANWEKPSSWKLVNSVKKPTGPVLDYRWEGFDEIVFRKTGGELKYQELKDMKKDSGTMVFSVRALRTFNFFLCRENNETQGWCFWIRLGCSGGEQSRILSCEGGSPNFDDSRADKYCTDIANASHETRVLNVYEWRTFRIEWKSAAKTIKLFNETEVDPFLQGTVKKWHPISHIFIQSETSSRVRFHFYNYYRTQKQNTELSTRQFYPKSQNFCVELLVGLCPNCQLNVNLLDESGQPIAVNNISGDKNSADNVPLSWKPIYLNASLKSPMPKFVRLKIVTILDNNKGEGEWAVDSFHPCKSPGSLRKSTIVTYQENTLPVSWPQVTCQKLSYRKCAVVNSLSISTIDDDMSKFLMLVRKSVRPDSYTSLGEKWSVCNPTGCACDRGYTGKDCATGCTPGSYGYNCNEQCGSCASGYCDGANGQCASGCHTEFLLPPFCREVEQPIVEDITDTTAKILQKVKPELLEYISNFLFVITGGEGTDSAITTTSLVESTYTINIQKLYPGTTIQAKTFVSTNFSGKITNASSREITFRTLWQGCFGVEPTNSSITVILHQDLKGCKLTGPYYAEIRRKSTGPYDKASVFPNSPIIITELEPHTKYKLTVYQGDGRIVLWTGKVRTLQSAPGKVRHLRSSHISDTNVTLDWAVPLQVNGIIAKYSVSIKRIKLLACEDLGQQTPVQDDITAEVNDTTVSFSGLNPYAKYTASVTAHTTEPGMKESTEFQTPERDIPTSSVRNLELTDNQTRLKWDKPNDCLKITGSTKFTKLVLTRLSDSGENRTMVENTSNDHFNLSKLNLAHYTSYNVRVYVLRKNTGDVNHTPCQETNWTTAPSAPSAVKKLDLYDVDLDKNTISLRWIPPHPPNGEIEFYHVSIDGGKNFFSTNWTINALEFWENYVYVENVIFAFNVGSNITMTVYAKNKNVDPVGISQSQTYKQNFFKTQVPAEPNNLPEPHSDHGVVTLKWKHPFSRIKITEFYITVKFLSTDLWENEKNEIPLMVNYILNETHPKEYSQQLFLATSTRYNISIISKYRNKSHSVAKNIEISVPYAFGFSNDKKLQVVLNGSLIDLKVPVIMNATRNTMVNVIVKGSASCTSRTSLSVINETELLVKVYNTNSSRSRSLTIDTNLINTEDSNCSLLMEETYEIKIVIKSKNGNISVVIAHHSITLSNGVSTLFWFISIIPIIAILFALCIWRRKFKRARRNANMYPKRAKSTHNLIALFTSKKSAPSPYPYENGDSGPIYAEPFDSDSRLVKAEYFPEYTRMAASGGLLLSQYMMFPRDLTKPCEYGKLPQNMPKNRDEKQIPYDDSRVVLQKIAGDPDSDYINASYIQGHRGEKAYIATQGPLPNTINDFWRMVWQEKVYVICMLTNLVENGKTKCEQYWPEVGIKVKYGDVNVLITDLKVFADYTIRNYRLTCQKYKRKITHLHYTAWPDKNIPTYSRSLVTFLKKLMDTPTGNGPVVVHCSTGDSRTGTLILCDICLRQAAEEKVIDVVAATYQMRESRANMVGSTQQYILAHVVITESITGMITQISCDEHFSTGIKRLREQLPYDIQRLNDTVWQEKALYSLVESKPPAPGDFARNKISEFDSVCPDVIYFERYSTPNSENSNYIGAVSVDGVKTKKEYLASALPSNSTWSKFWVVIAKQNVQLIIILQQTDPNNPRCCDIMPNKPTFAPVPHILVETKQTLQEEEHFTLEQLLLTDTSEEERRPQLVNVLRCTGWEQGKCGKPPSPATLVSLWRASGRILRKEGLSLVLCHDGVTGCGLYLALSFLLERMTVEKECDVISAVRAVRRFRPEFIQDSEDFEYLYDAAVNYINCFETYANFT